MFTFSTAHFVLGVGNIGRTFNVNGQMVNIQSGELRLLTSITRLWKKNSRRQ